MTNSRGALVGPASRPFGIVGGRHHRSRRVATCLVATMASAVPAFAQIDAAGQPSAVGLHIEDTTAADGNWPAALTTGQYLFAGQPQPLALAGARQPHEPPSRAWTALKVSFVGLEALDVVSTLRALDRGLTEANPLMRGVVSQPAMLIAVKGGTTVATLWLLQRAARRNRASAVLTLVAINAAYAVVVSHNLRAARTH